MRARLVLLASLLGGCNQLLGLDPTSLEVDAAGPGPIDAAAPDASVCPRPGQLGFVDEDGDTTDDRCDRCPADADDQADRDGDGVGDACDVTETPTRIALFDGFHDGELAGWVAVGINEWTETGDHAVLGNGSGISVLVAKIPVIQRGRVVAPVEITGLPVASDHVVGTAFSGGGISSYTCVADESGTTTASTAALYMEQGTSRTTIAGPTSLTAAFEVGAVLLTDARWNEGAQTCTAHLGVSVTLTGADDSLPPGTAGIYAQGAQVRVPYVVVYEEI